VSAQPRVALFCETFQEINGVALTARQLVAFARRQERPFLAIHGGARVARFAEGCVTRLELPRGRWSFAIESDLRYDLWLWRHAGVVREALEKFRPDAIHVTSPGEFGQLGAYFAETLKIPLVASWHTNLHQFAGRRLEQFLRILPAACLRLCCGAAERLALLAVLQFYKMAAVTLAPTAEQVAWLAAATGKKSFLMARGVDAEKFSPRHRTVQDGKLRLGYVGRVTPEKRVRFLVEIERALLATGCDDFAFLVVGDGSEREWLEQNLTHGIFTGVLRDEKLAEAYANMDLFVFPSRTDTYGNVIQEAAASGVAAIVTGEGGPKNLVVEGKTGFVAESDAEFIGRTLQLARDRDALRAMGVAARENMRGVSWDAAFEMVYAAYRYAQQSSPRRYSVGRAEELLVRETLRREAGVAGD
jgi:phosphatidylinositol alpha 1,6-mannosyltransferase